MTGRGPFWLDPLRPTAGPETHAPGGEARGQIDGPEQELETARIWEGWSPLSSDRELPVAIHFEPLAEELFEPLLAAREVCAR